MHADIFSVGKTPKQAKKLLSKVLWTCALEGDISLPATPLTLQEVTSNLVQKISVLQEGGGHQHETLYSNIYACTGTIIHPKPGVREVRFQEIQSRPIDFVLRDREVVQKVAKGLALGQEGQCNSLCK